MWFLFKLSDLAALLITESVCIPKPQKNGYQRRSGRDDIPSYLLYGG
jgi:hypothetical protein